MPKVLVAGDVAGGLEDLFKRVGTVNSKSGPFDCLLCTGEFFGAADVGGRCPDAVSARRPSLWRQMYARSALCGPMAPSRRRQSGWYSGRRMSRVSALPGF